MSNLRPGWLSDDERWREQLDSLPSTDMEWLSRQWSDAGGAAPHVDLSWLTSREEVPAGDAPVLVLMLGCFLLALLITGMVGFVWGFR